MASSVQDTFVPLGFARGEAAKLSVQLTKLAVDTASFNNAQDIPTMMAFQSALVGNHEAVRRFGIVITETELKDLKDLQVQMDNITIQLGQLGLAKINLDNQETLLNKQVSDLRAKEAEIAQRLSSKYGKGTLDVESGEFTPTSETDS